MATQSATLRVRPPAWEAFFFSKPVLVVAGSFHALELRLCILPLLARPAGNTAMVEE